MKEKPVAHMPWKLAEGLMNALACVAISAMGGVPKEGFSDEELDAINEYARETFALILDGFNDSIEWNIEEPEEEDDDEPIDPKKLS